MRSAVAPKRSAPRSLSRGILRNLKSNRNQTWIVLARDGLPVSWCAKRGFRKIVLKPLEPERGPFSTKDKAGERARTWSFLLEDGAAILRLEVLRRLCALAD